MKIEIRIQIKTFWITPICCTRMIQYNTLNCTVPYNEYWQISYPYKIRKFFFVVKLVSRWHHYSLAPPQEWRLTAIKKFPITVLIDFFKYHNSPENYFLLSNSAERDYWAGCTVRKYLAFKRLPVLYFLRQCCGAGVLYVMYCTLLYYHKATAPTFTNDKKGNLFSRLCPHLTLL